MHGFCSFVVLLSIFYGFFLWSIICSFFLCLLSAFQFFNYFILSHGRRISGDGDKFSFVRGYVVYEKTKKNTIFPVGRNLFCNKKNRLRMTGTLYREFQFL